MSDTLPHRLRETSFRRFEHDIAFIVDRYPMVVELDYKSKGYSVLTYEARLRDAMKSLFENGWSTTIIDSVKFFNSYSDIVVSHQTCHIFAGSRKEVNAMRHTTQAQPESQHLGNAMTSPASHFLPSTGELQTFHIECDNEAVLIARLASARVLLPIQISGVSDSLVQDLESKFDVAFTKNSDGTWTVL